MNNDNLVYAWTIVISFYLIAVCHLLWHWPVLKQMSGADKFVRHGILSLFLAVPTATLGPILGFDSIWRRPWLAITGVCILIGYIMLLWQFRHRKSTAALQPSIGSSSHSIPPAATVSTNHTIEEGTEDDQSE